MGLMKFPAGEAICKINKPTQWTKEGRQLFVDACREFAVFHYENNADIKFLYGRHGFDPKSIRSESDIERIPTLGVTAMKKFLMTSLPHDQMVLHLTSSGTRGLKTQIWFDQASLDRVQKMLDVYLDEEGFVSKNPCNYLILNYDPEDAKDLGVAYTEHNQLRFAPKNEVYFAIRKDSSGQWVFDKDRCVGQLQSYVKQKLPIRIFGMPAFLLEFLEHLQSQNASVKIQHATDQSWILIGGGWKAAEDKKITRAMLRNMCFQTFGIPESNQRDAFGMAEHCAPYFECSEHAFHIPMFNHLIMRDPATLKPVPDGDVGLMELISPFNAMMPNLALLSTDYAKINKKPCACGANSPTFEVIGRAGITKHKGCAMTAHDIVRRV
jgi:phenylacetate-coenzyme A ligase PaaK-like adenylate-forming protein